MAREVRLTKSKYLNALQCQKRLWLEENTEDRPAPLSPSRLLLLERGTQVGVYARRSFADGLLIRSHGEKALEETEAALAGGCTCLFEAAFVYEGVFVRCDILCKQPDDTWAIIEVKASTTVKPEHYHDLAIQHYVVGGQGMPVGSVQIMHINSAECRYPELDNLFKAEDVTDKVRGLLGEISGTLDGLRALLALDHEPDIAIGKHCDKPYSCPLKRHCWQSVPRASIFTIPNLNAKKIAELVSMGIMSLADLPADYPLSPAQRDYDDSVVAQRTEIDHAAIGGRLSELEYPIYFFDFETFSYAIPRFEGFAPYQPFPFQYSCHVLDASQNLSHREYLHEEDSDPRKRLLEHLIDDIGSEGSIVVYYAPFERTVLSQLAKAYPKHGAQVDSMIARLWDQHLIFRNHYHHPGFLGSTSIKRVLPVLAPSLSYDDLDVQRGDDAQAVWQKMLISDNQAEKEMMRSALVAYCERDTLAMVEIHRILHRTTV